MTREDLIEVRDRIASKLDEKTREEFMGLYDIVATPNCGGMTADEMKRLLNNKTLDEICWNKYMYLREQAKSLKNVVIVGKSGGYYVVLDCTPEGIVQAISEDGESYCLDPDQYKVMSGIHNEKFMDAMVEMHSYVVDRNRQAVKAEDEMKKKKRVSPKSKDKDADTNGKHVKCVILGGF